MERVENDFGKTVGIRVTFPEDFDRALSEARRLFYDIGQVGDMLVSTAAWPHASPTPTKPVEPEEKTVPRLGSASASDVGV